MSLTSNSGIKVIGEDNRPRIICGNCKNPFLVDIRPFQNDMSRVAHFDCPSCRQRVYAGVLLIGNTKLDGLMDMIQAVMQTLGQAGANVDAVGYQGQNAGLKS